MILNQMNVSFSLGCVWFLISNIQGVLFSGFSFNTGSHTCPSIPSHKPNCGKDVKHLCSVDKDCKKDELCCYNGCRKTCLTQGAGTLFIEGGPCKAIDTRYDCNRFVPRRKMCASDSQCKAHQACCFNGCSYVCKREKQSGYGSQLKPLKTTTQTPRSKPDNNVINNEVDTTKFDKSGSCPHHNTMKCNKDDDPECLFDIQCGFDNDLKCCPDQCGVHKCIKPENPCVNTKKLTSVRNIEVKVNGKSQNKSCKKCSCDQLISIGDDFMKSICDKPRVMRNCCFYCDIVKHL